RPLRGPDRAVALGARGVAERPARARAVAARRDRAADRRDPRGGDAAERVAARRIAVAPRARAAHDPARRPRARRRRVHQSRPAGRSGGGAPRFGLESGVAGVAVERRRLAAALLAEPPGGVDRGAEVEAFVLRLLDQHHRLDRVHVVDPLLLALRRDLRLVRPVVELHLRDARKPAHLAQVELDLVEVLCEIDWLEQIYVLGIRHPNVPRRRTNPSTATYIALLRKREGLKPLFLCGNLGVHGGLGLRNPFDDLVLVIARVDDRSEG